MKVKEIFLFELRYRKARAATYVYFGVLFVLCFFAIASPLRIAVGQIKANAPYLIAVLTVLASFIFTVVTSAVMGVAVVRDFDHNTEALMFSTPIRKIDYLLGRFGGSLLVLILINCGVWLGFMSAFAIGKSIPWEIFWRDKEMLPFNAWTYWQPFLLFTVTNLFVTGSLFFMCGALGRNSLVIYTQGIVLIVLYQIANNFLRDLDWQEFAAVIDPFGVLTFQHVTRYWTPAEQNTLLVPFSGVMLYNRILWVSIGVLALVVTYFRFSRDVSKKSTPRKGKKTLEILVPVGDYALNVIRQVFGVRTYVRQLAGMAWLYFRMVWKEIPFLAIIGCGMLLLFVNAAKMTVLYGTSSYPTTYAILTLLNSFNLFFLIVAILYSGELVWKERAVNLHLIMDAMPMPSFIALLAKFIGLVLTYAVLLFILMLTGILIQALYGYFNFNISIYLGTLYTSTFSFLILYTLLAIFVQVLVNNKFLGFAVCVVFYVITALLTQFGFEHGMWQFASGTLGIFSDMNVYGHFVAPFSWFKTYWLAFSMLLFSAAVIFYIRGSDAALTMRWQAGRLRLTRAMVIFVLCTSIVFLSSGFYIYYNTSIINPFEKTADREGKQTQYERELKKYEFLDQPRITEANLAVNLYPSAREFSATGFYYLKNKSQHPMQDIHIQNPIEDQVVVDYVRFNRKANVKQRESMFRYTVYHLDEPLQPGDSLKMDFKLAFVTRGFLNARSNTNVIYNGTFFNNQYFPGLGYAEGYELGDDDLRRQHGLKERERMLSRDDPRGRAVNLFGDDADHMRFSIVVSTEKDQTVIAPGYLQKEWTVGDRRYFSYQMDAPIVNFYSIVSARYAIKRDKWRNVNLEIYYHPGHEYNLTRMMESMKDALAYYSKNFSPYQYHQLRIMEFPRYFPVAQSFANTIPFSEGIGFILKIRNPDKDLDMAYYVTAHEVAHQWWGHQVTEARVKGSAMLSEGMSQYSALMVMKHAFPPEIVERYLKYELDTYLTGRAAERKKEQPLQFVESQPYIYYNKASLVFYALQDYVSEDSVNAAFRRYDARWAFRDAPYPTSEDLLREIRKVVPDSLHHILHDMFETITLFENRAIDAVYQEKGTNKYELTLSVSSGKIVADSAGVESTVPVDDWIDIGVYSKDNNGKDKLIYLHKVHVTTAQNKYTILLSQKPSRAGIDPLHKLIDRHSNDNTVEASRFIEIGNIQIQQ